MHNVMQCDSRCEADSRIAACERNIRKTIPNPGSKDALVGTCQGAIRLGSGATSS